jgi:hypothetical protein
MIPRQDHAKVMSSQGGEAGDFDTEDAHNGLCSDGSMAAMGFNPWWMRIHFRVAW